MDPYEAVGCGIEVFRSPQESWVRGKIEEYDVQVGFRVLYENGDEQWEDASNMERLHIQPREDTSTSARLQHDYMTLDLKRECVEAEFYDASDDEENNATPTKYAVNQGSDVVNKTNDHEGNTNTDQMTRTSDIKDTSLTKKLDVELLETHGKDESSNSLTMDSNSGAALTTINKSVACLEHDPQGSPTKNNYFNSRDSQLCSMNAAQLDPKEFDERHDNTDCSTGKSNACWTQPSPELSCSLVAIDSFQDKGRNERSSSQIFKSEETAICDNLGENSSSSKRAVLPDICLNETNMVVISDYKPRFEFEVQSAQLDDELHLAFISGQVLYFRSEPQVEWSVFVKVSMVRPGSHSLTNRNTTTIYTTDTITTSLQPSWIDSIWSHLIRCPEDGMHCLDEIIYSVYRVDCHANNILLGQVQIPIREYVDAARFPDQTLFFESEYGLKTRQGKCVPGLYLKVDHRIKLSSKALDATEKRLNCEPAASTESKQVREDVNREISIDKHKMTPPPHSRISEKMMKTSTARAYSARQPLSARRREKSGVNIPNSKAHAPRQMCVTQQKKSARTESTTTFKSNQRIYQLQLELADNVTVLQEAVAKIQNQVTEMKMALTRYSTNNNKSRTTIASLKQSLSREGEKTNTLKIVPCELNFRTTEDLPPETHRHCNILIAEQQHIMNERNCMIDEMKRLVSEENSLTSTLTSIQENIVRSDKLQQLSTSPDPNGSKQELSLRVQAYNELERLKASILALEQMKPHSKLSKELETSADVDNLEKKLLNRQEKEQQMASEASDYRAQYESIVQAGNVNILRQRVMDLHLMVLLCERQGTNA